MSTHMDADAWTYIDVTDLHAHTQMHGPRERERERGRERERERERDVHAQMYINSPQAALYPLQLATQRSQTCMPTHRCISAVH